MTATPTLTLPQKLDSLENTLLGKLLERKTQVVTAVTALVARAHHCQYGPPGVAKTMLIDELTKLIEDALSFRWLMTRFTTPDELFGPVSFKGLKDDKFLRTLDGKMIGTDLVFLDEIFKANSAILNALLTLMNEGMFFNGDQTVYSRPIIFSGSNELPRDAELAALWDRVTFRLETKPIVERGNMEKMLQARVQRHLSTVQIDPIISWAEILEAQNQADQVQVGDNVIGELIKLQANLRKNGIEPTDRRFADCIPIIKASAWRDGRTSAEIDDMGLLKHVLWEEVGQIATVEKLVTELANPLDREALQLIDTVEELSAEVDAIIKESDNEQVRRRKGIEINGKLRRVNGELDDLLAKSEKSPKRSDMVEQARVRLAGVVSRLLQELFNITEKEQ